MFRYGVVPAGAGAAPVSCACPTTRSSRNCARCGPSLATTASSASSHSRVSWGSTSTCDAIAAPDLLGARPLWLINPARAFWKTRSMIRNDRVRHDPAHASVWSTSTARRRPTSSASTATATSHELRDLLVSVALSGDLEAVHLRRRQRRRAGDRHAEEHGLRVRQGGGDRGRRRSSRCGSARHFLGGAITRARVEVREVAWARLGDHAFTQSVARAARRRRDRRGRRRRGSRPGSTASWCSRRPTPSSTASRATATRRWQETTDRVLATAVVRALAPRRRRGLRRGRAARAARHVRRAPLAVAAADALRDGRGGAGGVPDGRRGAPVDAQQAPLRRRPVAVRARERQRGLPRRRPPVRADRGRRRPRRRPRCRARSGTPTP